MAGDHIGEFRVSFPEEAMTESFSGRVVVYLSKFERQPRFSELWINRISLVGADFRDVAPGEVMWLSDTNAMGCPVAPSDMERGTYFVQAVLDRALTALYPGRSPGNLYSEPVEVTIGKEGPPISLSCNMIIPEPDIQESEWAKLVRMQSRHMSAFRGKPVFIQAKAHLPKEWQTQPERRFPVVLFIPGSGFYLDHADWQTEPGEMFPDDPSIVLWLESDGYTGHAEFADSANSGPWGRALVEELLPAVERRFRGYGHREARMIRGHSSGGGAALRLMMHYPDMFGYCWASAPSPVHFRDFHGVNIYENGANLFYLEDGDLRPIVQIYAYGPVAYFKEISDRERILGRGVLRTLEVIYSPRSQDGQPTALWDRTTGAIDPEVAEHWRKGDLGDQLLDQWEELEPKLAGRVCVTVGEFDQMGLAGPWKLLREELGGIGAGLRIRLLRGSHFTATSPEVYEEECRRLFTHFRLWRDGEKAAKDVVKDAVLSDP